MTLASSRKAVLSARALTKSYRRGEVDVQAQQGVERDLFEGEMVVTVGASGSGKSTLLNLIGGLDAPTSWSLTYGAQELVGAGDRLLTQYRRTQVGFVFQFYNLIPSLTARENVVLVTEIAESPLSAEQALELVGLADRMDHFPSQMSGGQQQRVAIARAIAKRPRLLLCDEPTGALDAETGKLVLEVIDRANREIGTTTALITHNAMIGAIADRVVTIADGRIHHITVNDRRASPREVSW